MSGYNTKNKAVKRILQEIKEVQEDTSGDFLAEALETDIFEWHFVIRGPPDTEFEGGLYHGRILLPAEYPFKPPAFMMLTPQGRFEPGVKLCLSMSSHHPEAWQPSWSVRTAIVALIAFMPTPGQGALGSLDYTKEERKVLAAKSREGPPKFGSADKQRVMAELHQRMLAMEAQQKSSASAQPGSSASAESTTATAPHAAPPSTPSVPSSETAVAGAPASAARPTPDLQHDSTHPSSPQPPNCSDTGVTPPQSHTSCSQSGGVGTSDTSAATAALPAEAMPQDPAPTETTAASEAPGPAKQDGSGVSVSVAAAESRAAAATAPGEAPERGATSKNIVTSAGVAATEAAPRRRRTAGSPQRRSVGPASNARPRSAAQDMNGGPDTRGLTAIAITLVILIVAILMRKILAAAGYNVPSIVSSFSS